MKIFILSITAGYGHHSAANAIENALTACGTDVKLLDLFKESNKLLYKAIDKGFSFTLKRFPYKFGRLYRKVYRRNLTHSFVKNYMRSGIVTNKWKKIFEEEKPDVVVTTHVFASLMVDKLIVREGIQVRHIGVMTDYTVYPFWEDVHTVEKLTVCSELMIPRAVEQGIPYEKLLPAGIPADDKFSHSLSSTEARRILGIEPDLPTILLMSGSMGFVSMAKAVTKIASAGRSIQILCICGKNERLKKTLKRQKFPVPVYIYGFADNVDVMMDAADLVVTKPGGLSTTETLIKGKPLIITAPLPGQEEDNTDYLLNIGVALRATPIIPVHELIQNILDCPALLEQMQGAIEKFVIRDATKRISEYIID